MTVVVEPASFSFVDFDAGEIARITGQLLERIGLPADLDARVEVNERSPLGIAELRGMDPVLIYVESGALEDPKRPKQLSATATADVLGRLLVQVSDRLDPAFGAPGLEEGLSLYQRVAWDTYAMGRLARMGYPAQRQRRLYHFRNCHGFSDVSDACFERLWSGEDLKWPDVVAASEQAAAPAVLA
ncbi:MAG: hypothetical protein JJLCMIEE_01482 [Acidimicrobiales bacterium]|nr:MAG: hypothetical protein EDR02_06325 [Actinomycetota bacterium]MBV6508421.1 hypothetical protein [Acidimicrobiales bacterium]RIK04772.1 MAG: hypothetical protein DCC48_12020 [Acidobacteriota bacterium]